MRKLFAISSLITIFAASATAGEHTGYTRVCMSGENAGTGACPANPSPGEAANEWACTRDNASKLLWSLESRSGHWNFATTTYPASVNAAGRCGHTAGWRAPTRSELLSIRDANQPGKQAINTNYFPGTAGDWYWTADTFEPDPSYAWFVYFVTGYNNRGNAYSGFKTYTQHVRLVR